MLLRSAKLAGYKGAPRKRSSLPNHSLPQQIEQPSTKSTGEPEGVMTRREFYEKGMEKKRQEATQRMSQYQNRIKQVIQGLGSFMDDKSNDNDQTSDSNSTNPAKEKIKE